MEIWDCNGGITVVGEAIAGAGVVWDDTIDGVWKDDGVIEGNGSGLDNAVGAEAEAEDVVDN